jgi:hypothetical protein
MFVVPMPTFHQQLKKDEVYSMETGTNKEERQLEKLNENPPTILSNVKAVPKKMSKRTKIAVSVVSALCIITITLISNLTTIINNVVSLSDRLKTNTAEDYVAESNADIPPNYPAGIDTDTAEDYVAEYNTDIPPNYPAGIDTDTAEDYVAELTPSGGRIDGSTVLLDDKYGYITYGNLNRADNFFAHLGARSHNASFGFFGNHNEFEQLSMNLVATNKGNYEIIITEITSRITNIKQINEPLLLAVAQEVLLNRTRGHEIVALVENHGWADAKDVMITATDNSGQLQKLINNYPLSIDIGSVESGGKISEVLLSNHMFIQQSIPNDGLLVSLEGILSYADANGALHEQRMHIEDFFLAPDGIRPPANNASGGGHFDKFGIFIDANQESAKFSRETYVLLTPGEVVDLPIRLFTNRSATFDLEVEITVNYSNTSTWAKLTGIELFVSSINGSNLVDGELLYRYSLEWDDLVFFPYSH